MNFFTKNPNPRKKQKTFFVRGGGGGWRGEGARVNF